MDSSGLSTYGLNGHEWEMSTPPTPQLGHGRLYLYLYCVSCTAVNVIPGHPGIPGTNVSIPEFPGMKKGVQE